MPSTSGVFTFDRLMATLLFLAIALAALLMPAQNDTWWQMRAGREMWLNGHVLLHDTFSHTVYGTYWPNHEWLSQLLLYGAYAAGGMSLVTIVSAAAVTAAWLLVWRMTPGSTRAKFLLTSIAVVCASTIWSPRPQVLSLLLLAVTVSLLRSRRYVWLPMVFLLWANLHGAVVMGFLVLGAALVAAAVEDRQHARALAIASGCCLLMTVATPLGVSFWTEIPRSLGRIRQLGIAEWAPPRLTAGSLIPFWLMAAALLGLIAVRGREWLRNVAARRPGDLTVCACALVLLPLALTAERNVPSFLLLAVPAIAVLSRFNASGGRLDPAHAAQRPRLNFAIAVVAAVLVTGGVAYAYATPIDHLRWAPFPEASLAALRSCHGNLYNRYDEGGYLIWFAPDHKVFLDGRQDPYPVDLVKRQVQVESSGEFEPLFRQYDIRCAFIPADSLISVKLAAAGWQTLFRDAHWAVLAD